MKRDPKPICPRCHSTNTVYAQKTRCGDKVYGCLDCRKTKPIEACEFTERQAAR